LVQAIQKRLSRRTLTLDEILMEVNKVETATAILTESLRTIQKKWNLPLAETLTTMAHRLENS
jgi:hypothetical protein